MEQFLLILTQLLVAATVTVICICVQTVGNIALLYWVLHALSRFDHPHWVLWSISVVVRLISAFVGIHICQIGIWTLTYLLLECFPDIEEAIYFSLATFSTAEPVGVTLPPNWRLLGPFESFGGIIALGLSIGFMYTIIGRMLEDRMRRIEKSTPNT